MGRKFRLEFDGEHHPNGVVHAGGIISGKVVLDFHYDILIETLTVQLRGEALSSWLTDPEYQYSELSASEIYYDKDYKIVEYDPGAGLVRVPRGIMTYHFEHRIPPDCPSSYIGQFCKITNTCAAQITFRAVLEDGFVVEESFYKHATAPFTVIHDLDLNLEPASSTFLTPEVVQNSFDVICCYANKGSVETTFEINRKVYVPGEYIICTITVDNHSSTSVDCALALKQYETCIIPSQLEELKWDTQFKGSLVSFLSLNEGRIPSHDTVTLSNVRFRIPSVPPSRLDGCDIVDLKYVLKLYVKSWREQTLEHEILIGTVPLRERQSVITRQPGASCSSETTALVDAYWDAPPPYEPPPPSYEECILKDKRLTQAVLQTSDDDDDLANSDDVMAPFLPRYPVYTSPQLPAIADITTRQPESETQL